jgi:hypothetical protein
VMLKPAWSAAGAAAGAIALGALLVFGFSRR